MEKIGDAISILIGVTVFGVIIASLLSVLLLPVALLIKLFS